MPKANHDLTTGDRAVAPENTSHSRRNLLAAVLAGVAVGGAGRLTAPDQMGAELLATGAEFKAKPLDGELLAACSAYHQAFARREDPKTPEGDELDGACIACSNTLTQIAMLSPCTLKGAQAKATVAYSQLMWEAGAGTRPLSKGHDIALAVLRDIGAGLPT